MECLIGDSLFHALSAPWSSVHRLAWCLYHWHYCEVSISLQVYRYNEITWKDGTPIYNRYM